MKEQIIDYLHYLTIERGLSQNTRKSYERDLEQYLTFLTEQHIKDWQAVDRVLILSFCSNCSNQGNPRRPLFEWYQA